MFANFVTTLDGIVSYGLPGRTEARFISAGHPADRFVLGLLRAVADAVVVGAGTLRGEPGVTWSPEAVFPEASDAFRQLRSAMRKPARPLTVITTRSGKIDLNAPAVTEGAPLVILTSAAGAARLGGVPPHVRVRMLEGGDAAEIVAMAAAESGGRSILTEGGPTLFGQFLREGAVDELFMTLAPQLAGRAASVARIALVESAAFAPENAPWMRLRSLKTADDYVLARFAVRRG